MRKGFTLVELLLVIVVMGIATVSLVNAYTSSQVRIQFQLQASDIQSAISTARASALSDNTEEGFERIAAIDLTNQEIRSFVDVNRNRSYDEGTDNLLKEVVLDDEIEFRDSYSLLDVGPGVQWMGGSQEEGFTGFFIVIFSPPEPTCDFILPTLAETDPNQYMFELPLYRPEIEDPIRYIYFHKVSCIPELLSTRNREV